MRKCLNCEDLIVRLSAVEKARDKSIEVAYAIQQERDALRVENATLKKEQSRLEKEIIAEQHQTAHWLEVAQDMQTRAKQYIQERDALRVERDSANAHAESAEKAVVDFSKRLAAAEKERDDLDAAEIKYLDIIHRLEIEIEKVKLDLAHEEASFFDYEGDFDADGCATARKGGCLEIEKVKMDLAHEEAISEAWRRLWPGLVDEYSKRMKAEAELAQARADGETSCPWLKEKRP